MNEPLLLFAIGINKFTVNNWEEKKPKLLKLIELNDADVAFLDAKECKTDYFKFQTKPPYFEDFCKIMAEELDEIVDVFTEGLADRYGGECPVNSLDSWQLWSQQYDKGEYHGAHNHGMMNLSCVLYVEFDPKEHLPTTFYSPFPNPYYGTIHKAQPPVNEGEIIVFPSLLLHEAPVSPSDKQRTIMSFNIPLR
tara:strand:+ start:690 stop:1271 length:582 start_codon:yes stop_codon:yes gene_type:complete